MLKKSEFKTILLTATGGMLEMYDFVIFSLFAIVLGKTFFPIGESPAIQALSAFTVFAVGYFARPFGGIFFGHIGDKYGRKKSFLMTILIMGIASFAMALLPSYQTAGITASILFVLLRIVQGAAVGGEIPSAIVFIKETLIKNGGFACGVIFCFINMGIFFAEVTETITTSFLSDKYAWRVAFISGGIAAIVSYFFRKEIHETQAFLDKKKDSKLPVLQVFKSEKIATLKAIAAMSIFSITTGFFSLYLPTYFILNNTPNSTELILLNLFIFSFVAMFAGFLADKFGAYSILIVGAVSSVIFGSLFYLAIIYHFQYLLITMLLSSVSLGLIVGVSTNYASMLFRPSARASGLGISYNLSFSIFNGAFFALASLGIAKGYMLTPLYLVAPVVLMSVIILLIFQNSSKKIST